MPHPDDPEAKRERVLSVRLSEREYDELRRRALEVDRPVSSFVRFVVVRAVVEEPSISTPRIET